MRCLTYISGLSNETYVAPTQDSWLHRVYCANSWHPFEGVNATDDSMHFATELLTDRLLVVQSGLVDIGDNRTIPRMADYLPKIW